MYPIQIGFVYGLFLGKFAKYPGRPPCKNAKNTFHKQTPEKKLQNPMKSMYPVQIEFVFGVFGGHLLSTLPPCKNAKNYFMSRILK